MAEKERESATQNIDDLLKMAARTDRTRRERFEQRVSWTYGQYSRGTMSKEQVRQMLQKSEGE